MLLWLFTSTCMTAMSLLCLTTLAQAHCARYLGPLLISTGEPPSCSRSAPQRLVSAGDVHCKWLPLGLHPLLCRYHGRTRVMTYSGILFMVAAIILACAFNISQIFIGRVFQGIAVGPQA